MSDARPGRVYGLRGEPGVRDGTGYRFFTHAGVKVPLLVRVEFDADADEGMATAAGYRADAAGAPLVDYEKGEACRVTFRTWLRAVPPGRPDPAPTPDAFLTRTRAGIVRVGSDPLPDVPFEAEERRD